MTEVFAIAIGGALGALARYGLGGVITAMAGTAFPWATLVINVVGSFAIGVLVVVFIEQQQGSLALRSGLMVGLLGAFTTFSTFSLQTLGLIQDGRLISALLYILGSVTLGLCAVVVGIFVTRHLTG